MRILVFGAGAVGQGVGGFLAAAGHPTTLLLRPRYREALAREGLRVSGIFGQRVLQPGQLTLASDPAELAPGGYDVILLCVKSYDTGPSLPALGRVAGADAAVVAMQNGYGNVELLASALDKRRVLCARVITGFSIPCPGQVQITVHADDILIGSFYSRTHPAAEALAAALTESGLPARAVEDVEAALWTKILYNCALNPLGAILGVHYGALGDSADARAIMDAIIEEGFGVIHAWQFPCQWKSPAEFREVFYKSQIPSTYDHRPSMLQDLSAGKRTEIDALNGAIVRLAAAKGLAAPVNETIVRVMRFLEAARRSRCLHRGAGRLAGKTAEGL